MDARSVGAGLAGIPAVLGEVALAGRRAPRRAGRGSRRRRRARPAARDPRRRGTGPGRPRPHATARGSIEAKTSWVGGCHDHRRLPARTERAPRGSGRTGRTVNRLNARTVVHARAFLGSFQPWPPQLVTHVPDPGGPRRGPQAVKGVRPDSSRVASGTRVRKCGGHGWTHTRDGCFPRRRPRSTVGQGDRGRTDARASDRVPRGARPARGRGGRDRPVRSTRAIPCGWRWRARSPTATSRTSPRTPRASGPSRSMPGPTRSRRGSTTAASRSPPESTSS